MRWPHKRSFAAQRAEPEQGALLRLFKFRAQHFELIMKF